MVIFFCFIHVHIHFHNYKYALDIHTRIIYVYESNNTYDIYFISTYQMTYLGFGGHDVCLPLQSAQASTPRTSLSTTRKGVCCKHPAPSVCICVCALLRSFQWMESCWKLATDGFQFLPWTPHATLEVFTSYNPWHVSMMMFVTLHVCLLHEKSNQYFSCPLYMLRPPSKSFKTAHKPFQKIVCPKACKASLQFLKEWCWRELKTFIVTMQMGSHLDIELFFSTHFLKPAHAWASILGTENVLLKVSTPALQCLGIPPKTWQSSIFGCSILTGTRS